MATTKYANMMLEQIQNQDQKLSDSEQPQRLYHCGHLLLTFTAGGACNTLSTVSKTNNYTQGLFLGSGAVSSWLPKTVGIP